MRSAQATKNCWNDHYCAYVFVHGTGDYPNGSKTATSDYWTNDSLCQMSGSGGSGCTLGSWVYVAQYLGNSCDATGWACTANNWSSCTACNTSWNKVVNDVGAWNECRATDGDRCNVASCTTNAQCNSGVCLPADTGDTTRYCAKFGSMEVLGHSNGGNVLRSIMANKSNLTSANGTTHGRAVSSVTDRFRELILVATDMTGTPLANSVTTSGSFASIANGVVSFFGGGSYNSPAVILQRTDNMATANAGGYFVPASGRPSTVQVNTIHGTSVYANIFSSDAWCGGYTSTVALKATLCYGWGCSGSSDGFIGSDSATAFGTDINGNNGGVNAGRLNHNSSRRSCVGVLNPIKWAFGIGVGTTGGFQYDTTYTISPQADACNASNPGWIGSDYVFGCPTTPTNYKTDTITDYDCYVSYGGDNGHSADTSGAGGSDPTYGTITDGYTSTFYYSKMTPPNSYMGDGDCDMAMLAKYGYDAKPGTATGADDCVNRGVGTSTSCYDIAEYSSGGAPPRYSGSGAWYYDHYSQKHCAVLADCGGGYTMCTIATGQTVGNCY